MSDQKTFAELINALAEEFIGQEHAGESDEEIASAILEFCLKRERIRNGVANTATQAAAVDKATIDRMRSWDSDDPNMVVLEKIFRRIATGYGANGVSLLKKAIESKSEAFSASQREIARSPRKIHPVDNLIATLVTANPSISCKQLLRALSGQAGKGIILDIDEDCITPVADGFKPLKVSGLADRLGRIKKKIAKAG